MIDEKYEANWIMCIATMENSFLSKADNLLIDIVREKFKSKEI